MHPLNALPALRVMQGTVALWLQLNLKAFFTRSRRSILARIPL
jgi:hypothetical protein